MTPFTIVVKKFPVLVATFVFIIFEFEVTPFTFIPKLFNSELVVALLIIDEVEVTPFTLLVSTLANAVIVLLFIIPAVVVETIPFTNVVHTYEFVDVATVITFVVDEASRLDAEICCTTPLGP